LVEAVADLDQLAARHDHLAVLGERGEREEQRRRVVVDDQRRLCAGEAPEDACGVILARAARARLEVELEVRVAAGQRGERGVGKRRPAEIRVHDHARRVQHAAQRRRAQRSELLLQARLEVAGLRSGADRLACAVDHRTRGSHGKRVVGRAGELVDGRQIAQFHERNDTPAGIVASLSG